MAVDFARVGIAVGHAADVDAATGCTVVRAVDAPLRGGVAVFGRATGSRELYALGIDALADRVDAVLLTGGSAYGLDAAAGVMRWMEERNRGFPIAGGVVPIVPAAVIFDLGPLGRFDGRPTPEMAYRATDAAACTGVAEGSVGAGTGATVGKAAGVARAMKGGVGCALRETAGVAVAAVAVVNAFGDVRDAAGRIIAGARADGGGFVDASRLLVEQPHRIAALAAEQRMRNTTLAVVATNAALDRVQLTQLARAAGAALFHRITPAGSSFDGDIVFALGARAGTPADALHVEALAVAALEDAIERGVRLAVGRPGVPGLADAR
ncbi:MAG TPA: P1 family peptidase [Gemmatimonadaceae bacterium]|nr:P1 family peptidase [Gemmatimonadaceae bacterium]